MTHEEQSNFARSLSELTTRLETLSSQTAELHSQNITILEQLPWISSLLRSGADRQLITADRLEKNTAAADKLTDAILGLKQRLADLYAQNEERRGEVNMGLQHIFEKLVVLSKDVDDVEKVMREASGVFRTATTTTTTTKMDEPVTAVVVVEKFTTAWVKSRSLKLWVVGTIWSVIILVVLGLYLRHLFGK